MWWFELECRIEYLIEKYSLDHDTASIVCRYDFENLVEKYSIEEIKCLIEQSNKKDLEDFIVPLTSLLGFVKKGRTLFY